MSVREEEGEVRRGRRGRSEEGRGKRRGDEEGYKGLGERLTPIT